MISLLADLAGLLPAMFVLQLALILIFVGFGVAKFAHYEQVSIGKLVANHPALRHGPKLIGDASFSRLLGVVELFVAFLLLIGLIWPVPGMLGGLLGAGTFVVTASLLPFVQYFEAEHGKVFLSSRGQFLFKDIALLGACLVIAKYHASMLT